MTDDEMERLALDYWQKQPLSPYLADCEAAAVMAAFARSRESAVRAEVAEEIARKIEFAYDAAGREISAAGCAQIARSHAAAQPNARSTANSGETSHAAAQPSEAESLRADMHARAWRETFRQHGIADGLLSAPGATERPGAEPTQGVKNPASASLPPPPATLDREELIEMAREWLRSHERDESCEPDIERVGWFADFALHVLRSRAAPEEALHVCDCGALSGEEHSRFCPIRESLAPAAPEGPSK